MPRLLDGVTLDGQPVGLSSSIDYTLESLARPMLWIMQQMYLLTHNWAIAIILLTVLVKLILLYPSHRSMQSMKAMGQLKPQIEALKEKCGDDKQKFNAEMMALYKKHNINPVGGCLPILLQMPIYFALYSMLGNAVELYRVKLFWIPDLTAADPYFVLPLVTGALMYVQSKFLSPAPADPQQKAMITMMPVMFTVFTIFVPAGLTLYIMTNTILGMIQQVVINRGVSPNAAPVHAAAPVAKRPRSGNSSAAD
jgi:YidC/Oxa1 family membrane protein insertase